MGNAISGPDTDHLLLLLPGSAGRRALFSSCHHLKYMIHDGLLLPGLNLVAVCLIIIVADVDHY